MVVLWALAVLAVAVVAGIGVWLRIEAERDTRWDAELARDLERMRMRRR